METLSTQTKIRRGGLHILAHSSHGPRLKQVLGLSCNFQPSPGRWALAWKPAPGAVAYQVSITPNLNDSRRWIAAGTVSQNRLLFAAPQGWWVSVRAVDGGGAGAWSDPVETRRTVAPGRRAEV